MVETINCRKYTHDAVVRCIKDLASIAGIKARVEEQHCFREAFPNNAQKGDLSLWNVPDATTAKTVCDVTITHTAPGVMARSNMNISINDALKPGRAASIAKNRKIIKYGAISAANNLEFQPLVFETTGRIEEASLKFINHLITHMSRGDPRMLHIYSCYWLGRLSCCLQKNMATAIIQRSNSINGDFTSVSNYEFMDRFIIDNHNIRS